MTKEKKHVSAARKVFVSVTIPLFVIALAVCALCEYVENYYDKVLSHTFVAGVDLSGMTRQEAQTAIDPAAYDARGNSTEVAITFPDGSVINITGEDAGFTNDALYMVDRAYNRGRGDGYIEDTLQFIRHLEYLRQFEFLQSFVAQDEFHEISYALDTELLRSCVAEFTQNYNDELEGAVALVYSDRIVLVKGAGEVCASETDIYDLALNGLLESLRGGYPVELEYTLPEATMDAERLLMIREDLQVIPLCAEYDPETKSVSESVVGVDIDMEGAIALLANAETGTVVSISVEYTQPAITQEFLENLLFRDLIGECVTQIPGSENRLSNIILAASSINGLILEPGEEFSFNRVVGQRTPERGFRSAPAFSNGTTVMAIGGGICQVSSTMYSSIMDTSLQVTERHPHGLPVSYIPRGRDATVNWGSLDFRFVNNTDYPLRIDIDVTGRTITVQVYGTLAGSSPVGA